MDYIYIYLSITATMHWKNLHPSGDPPPPRFSHSSILFLERYLLVFGGCNDKGEPADTDLYVYDSGIYI